MNYLAIDPGASGGMAYYHPGLEVEQAIPMPEGMTAQFDALRHLQDRLGPFTAVIEKVGTYRKGNSGPAAATFASHVGGLHAACYALGIAELPNQPTPQKWMKAGGFGVSRYLPEDYKALQGKAKDRARAAAVSRNKHDIQEHMQRAHLHLRVTLKTADALAILAWAEGQI